MFKLNIIAMKLVKVQPIRNADKFKIKLNQDDVFIPENELIVGGDAPSGCDNLKRKKEIEDLYNTFLKKK